MERQHHPVPVTASIRRAAPLVAKVSAPAVELAAENETRPCACGRHDIRRMALSAHVAGHSAARVQRAMNVSQPGDPSEVEADRVADSVMRMPSPPSPAQSEALAARESALEEEEVKAKPAETGSAPADLSRQAEVARENEKDEDEILAKRVERSNSPVSGLDGGGDVSGIVSAGLSGGGQPLDSASRAFFEPRLGQDLSNIRVHTNAAASASTEQVSARAYAVGGDIAFRQGEYNPGTSAGRHLMAHELAHTIQQGATKPLSPSREKR